MYSKIANACANMFQKNNIIKPEEREIYQYGIEVGVATLVNVATTLAIGLIMRMPVESLVVLLCYIAIRAYSGGFHASSDSKCYIISAVIIILNLAFARIVLHLGLYHVSMIVGCVAGAFIFFLSPVVHENRPLDDDEYPIFKKRARVIVVVLLTATTFLYFLKIYNVAVTSSITIFFVGLSVLLGYIRQKMIQKRSA